MIMRNVILSSLDEEAESFRGAAEIAADDGDDDAAAACNEHADTREQIAAGLRAGELVVMTADELRDAILVERERCKRLCARFADYYETRVVDSPIAKAKGAAALELRAQIESGEQPVGFDTAATS